MRSRGAVWLLIHASCLDGADATAVVIEPAKASEVAPLIVEAYELTPRDRLDPRALHHVDRLHATMAHAAAA